MFIANKGLQAVISSTHHLVRQFSSEYTKQILLPSAKRLVAIHNLDASKIIGTGLGGRLVGYDVVTYMNTPKSPMISPKAQTKCISTPTKSASIYGANYIEEPIKSSDLPRIAMDEHIKRMIPHSYMNGSANMSSLASLLSTINSIAGMDINTTDIAVKAISTALCKEVGLTNINVNIYLGIGYNISKCFTITAVNEKSLLDIHKAIDEGKQAEAMPLTGHVTLAVVDTVEGAGGMLSSANELGTMTIGELYKTIRVVNEETSQIEACTMINYNFSMNAMKLDEIHSSSILSSFKSYLECPDYLLE